MYKKMALRVHPLPVLLVVVLAGCAPVRFISDYDEETDRRSTELHLAVEAMLTAVEAETNAGGVRIEDVYPDVFVELRSLKLRASARPRNELQVAQFEELGTQLQLFSEAYREGLSPAEVPLFRRGFEQSFRAILTLELAKKRGPE